MILIISAISPIKVPMYIITSIIAISAIAVSNRYLQARPLPYFSSSYSLASGNNWSSANKTTNLTNLTGSYSSTKSYRSSR